MMSLGAFIQNFRMIQPVIFFQLPDNSLRHGDGGVGADDDDVADVEDVDWHWGVLAVKGDTC